MHLLITSGVLGFLLVSPPLESLSLRLLRRSKRECRCTPNQLRAYGQRLSDPLLDRIDIHIEVPSVDFSDLNRADSGEPSATIRARIAAARAVRADRFAREPNIRCNAAMSSRAMKAHTHLAGPLLDPSTSIHWRGSRSLPAGTSTLVQCSPSLERMVWGIRIGVGE